MRDDLSAAAVPGMVAAMPVAPDRFFIDRVARAVVSGTRGRGRRADALADAAAAFMRGKLEAAGAPGSVRAARVRPRAWIDADEHVRRVIDRASKHLAATVLVAEGRRARAHPR